MDQSKLKKEKHKRQSICNVIENGSSPLFSKLCVVRGYYMFAQKSLVNLNFFPFLLFVTNETPHRKLLRLLLRHVVHIESRSDRRSRGGKANSRNTKIGYIFVFTPSCLLHTSNIYPKKVTTMSTHLFSLLLEEYFWAVSTHSSGFLITNDDKKKYEASQVLVLTNADQFQGKYVSIY